MVAAIEAVHVVAAAEAAYMAAAGEAVYVVAAAEAAMQVAMLGLGMAVVEVAGVAGVDPRIYLAAYAAQRSSHSLDRLPTNRFGRSPSSVAPADMASMSMLCIHSKHE